MRYWLMKSEPDEFSIDDLAAAPNQTTAWFGVRNYQARNFMRDEMRVGDRAFFYHSSCDEPGVAGIVEISKSAYPDETQFDPKSPYYDPKSTRAAPRWLHIDVKQPDGSVERWKIEGGSPSVLFRLGWNRNSLPAGTKVTVVGFQAKDGSLRASSRDLRFPDGRRMDFGGSGSATDPKK